MAAINMHQQFTKSGFESHFKDLFESLTQREWLVAESLVGQCRSYANDAFSAGYREVANYAIKRMDDLVAPLYTEEYRATDGYNRLWRTREMKSFILSHLDFSPAQAVDLIGAVSWKNAAHVVSRVCCYGLMTLDERAYERDLPSLSADHTLTLCEKLIGLGCVDEALTLVTALASAEEIERSDLYVDCRLVKILAGISNAKGREADLLSHLAEPIERIRETCKIEASASASQPDIEDILVIATSGLRRCAKQLILTADFGAEPVRLGEVAQVLGEDFSRNELAHIANSPRRRWDNSHIWFGLVLDYWLKQPSMAWPYAHNHQENGIMPWVVKSTTVSTKFEDFLQEARSHAGILKDVMESASYKRPSQRSRTIVKVINLILQSHNQDEMAVFADELLEIYPKKLMMGVDVIRDRQFEVDLGL